VADEGSGPAFLRDLDLSEAELTKAIIGAIGDLDAYLLPDAKGFTSLTRYLTGDTDEARQQFRDEVLSTTAADFKSFGEVLAAVKDHGEVVVLGTQESINQANAERGNWLEVTKVL
jgi:Zn-dependent M16 (insulinase) family peptidase